MAAEDPPSRAVQLKYMSGQVSVQPGGVNDWVAATINRPLATADRVWTDKESRAELHLGTAALRMNSETSLTLSDVTDNTVQVELDQGTLNLRVRKLSNGEIYEVDTPNLAFTIRKTGVYRFDVDSNGDTTSVTVFKGEGDATGDGPTVRVRSHEQARFSSGRTLAHQVASAPGFDSFDDWCRVRDDREDKSVSAQYVSPTVPGYEELDAYGSWRTIPPYGPVWVPTTVVAGWAPYRFGHWIWVAPWGWTWVDDAPWGYAPFHYGRWVYYGGFWGWAPGPVVVRPVYAPALVAWVGGAHWGVGLSFGAGGGVGWFPLGWGEPYIPSYRCSRSYFQNVNVTNTRITNITYVTNNYYNNTTNITKIKYVNQTAPGGVTVVHREVLENAQPVGRSVVHIDNRQFSGSAVMNEPGVNPSRHSVLGMHEDRPAVAPPANVTSRPVVSRMTPPSRPAPFHEIDKDKDRDRNRERDDDRHANSPNRAEPSGHAPMQPTSAGSTNTPPPQREHSRPDNVPDSPPGRTNANLPTSQPNPPAATQPSAEPETGRSRGRGFPHPPERGTETPEPARNTNAGQPASNGPKGNDDAARGNGNQSQPGDDASRGHEVPHPSDHGKDMPEPGARGNAGQPASNGPKGNDDAARGRGNQSQPADDASRGHEVPHPSDHGKDMPEPGARGNGGQPASNAPKTDDGTRSVSNPPQPAANAEGRNIPRPPQRGWNMPDAAGKANTGNQANAQRNEDAARGHSSPGPSVNASARPVPRPADRQATPSSDVRPSSPKPVPTVQRNDAPPPRANASVDRPAPHSEHTVSAPQQNASPPPRSAPAEQRHAAPPPHETKPADKHEPAKQSEVKTDAGPSVARQSFPRPPVQLASLISPRYPASHSSPSHSSAPSQATWSHSGPGHHSASTSGSHSSSSHAGGSRHS